MNLSKRVEKLQKRIVKKPVVETIFRELDEKYEDALKRGKETYPNADHLIIISWIRP
jgi:hypothetical protein